MDERRELTIVLFILIFFKKHFKLLAGVIAIAVLACLSVFFNYSIWHLETNSPHFESHLIWHDPQSFPDKVSQLAKVTQTLKDSEAGLLKIREEWQTASNQFFTAKFKFDRLKSPIESKKQDALHEMQQNPEAYAAKFYPDQLTRQQKEIDNAKRQISILEDSITFDSKNIASIEQSQSMSDSQIQQLLIMGLGYSKRDMEDGMVLKSWKKQGEDKIRYDKADISRYQNELIALRTAIDQAPQALASNLTEQISGPFDTQIEDIANQTNFEKSKNDFQKSEAQRQRLENQKADASNEQAQNLDAIFKNGVRIRLYPGGYFFLPKHSEGFLCMRLNSETNGFLLHELKTDEAHTIPGSSIIRELPEEYFLTEEQKKRAVPFAEQQAKWAALEHLEDANAYADRGNVRYHEFDLTGAIADFSKAIELTPQCELAYYGRSLVKKTTGDLDGALADYNKAVEINPKVEAEAYYKSALLNERKGDWNGAIADYTKIIEVNPKYHYELVPDGLGLPKMAAVYDWRGLAKKNSGDLNGAVTDFNKALKIFPDDNVARTNLDELNVRATK